MIEIGDGGSRVPQVALNGRSRCALASQALRGSLQELDGQLEACRRGPQIPGATVPLTDGRWTTAPAGVRSAPITASCPRHRRAWRQLATATSRGLGQAEVADATASRIGLASGIWPTAWRSVSTAAVMPLQVQRLPSPASAMPSQPDEAPS